ncbi:hypothetical protein GCM10009557_95820 [Virgisporangium ochraceum]
MIGCPPVSAGATNATDTWASAGLAVPIVGAAGTAVGVTAGVDAADSTESPIALVACTVNVYGVPLVSPVTVHGLAEQVPVCPPGDEVAV